MLSRIRSHNLIRNVNAELIGLYAKKYVHQLVSARPDDPVALAILGCQRSGTSVMSRIFFRDLDCTVFREKSRLTGGAEGLRYRPFEEVRQIVDRERAALVVFKMLVESQRTLEFLQKVPNGRAVWLYRDYRDVVNSNLRKFGTRNGIDDLRPVVAGDPENWRSQNCSSETAELVRHVFDEAMNPQGRCGCFLAHSQSSVFRAGTRPEPQGPSYTIRVLCDGTGGHHGAHLRVLRPELQRPPAR